MIRTHHDIETCSTKYLGKRKDATTVERYVNAPGFDILLWSWCVEDKPIVLWDLTDDPRIPSELATILFSPEYAIYGFNVGGFERLAINRWLVLRGYTFQLPLTRFRDTMLRAYYAAFSGGLGKVGEQMGMPQNEKKLKDGTRLINKFGGPRRPSKKQPWNEWWLPTDAPKDWLLYKKYNVQDVEAERAIDRKLEQWNVHVPDWVTRQWYLDNHMNDFGVPIDVQALKGACRILDEELIFQLKKLKNLTKLENPNSRDQLLAWFKQNELPDLENLKAATLAEVRKNLTPEQTLLAEVIDTRTQLAKSSVKKLPALLRRVTEQNRVHGMFQIWGASRTGRDASRGINLQNVARGTIEDSEQLVDLIARGDRTLLKLFYGDKVFDLLSSSIRGMITAPPGKKLIVADLSSIESVLAAWICDCRKMIEIFRQGRDVYKTFAVSYFSKPYEEVTKAERFFCKPPVLGAQYMLAGEGLVSYAEGMGVTMKQDEADRAIELFRSEYVEIPGTWKQLRAAAMNVVEGYSKTETVARCVFDKSGPFLRIRLPTGRHLHYFNPSIEPGDYGPQLVYDGIDQYSGKWERVHTHAGKTLENIIQAIARDIFWYGIEHAVAQGIPVFGRIHDEAIAEVPAEQAETLLKLLERCLPLHPPGTQDVDLILGAKGEILRRYRKI